MYPRRSLLRLIGSLGLSRLACAQGVVREAPKRKANVLLVAADSTNRAAETLPRLAQQLESGNTMRCQVITGGPKDIPGIEDIEDVDLAVLAIDGVSLPAAQLGPIQKFANAGKPIVALRSTLHGFQNWSDFGPEVLGARWQYDYGPQSGTDVSVAAAADPLASGLPREFHSATPLVHVLPLARSCKVVLTGKSTGPSERTERLVNPVAWTNTHKNGRVFYTSLGGPEDFAAEPFRKLLANAVNWTLNR